MPTRKIGELVHARVAHQADCKHPEHNLPSLYAFDNGIYEHECPGCGYKRTFTVNRPVLK